MNQKAHAGSLVGSYVRFRHLPQDCYPTPIRVIEAVNGMIRLAGWTGYFAPHLFVVLERPQTAINTCGECMTAKEAIANLRATGAVEPVEYFLYLANHAHEARLVGGGRLNDATDFIVWLRELAEAAESSSGTTRMVPTPHFIGNNVGGIDKTCPRCGHVHEGDRECGMFIGSGQFCRCERKVLQ